MEEGQNRQYITSSLFFFCQHLLRIDISLSILRFPLPINQSSLDPCDSWTEAVATLTDSEDEDVVGCYAFVVDYFKIALYLKSL